MRRILNFHFSVHILLSISSSHGLQRIFDLSYYPTMSVDAELDCLRKDFVRTIALIKLILGHPPIVVDLHFLHIESVHFPLILPSAVHNLIES